jgi:hypothetical protein
MPLMETTYTRNQLVNRRFLEMHENFGHELRRSEKAAYVRVLTGDANTPDHIDPQPGLHL